MIQGQTYKVCRWSTYGGAVIMSDASPYSPFYGAVGGAPRSHVSDVI